MADLLISLYVVFLLFTMLETQGFVIFAWQLLLVLRKFLGIFFSVFSSSLLHDFFNYCFASFSFSKLSLKVHNVREYHYSPFLYTPVFLL